MNNTKMEIITSMNYSNTDNILSDMKNIIDAAQHQAHQAVNTTLVKRNWLIGYRIVEEELKGTTRTDNYGKEVMKSLSESLTAEYGKGFDISSLYKFKKFYEIFPDILDSLSSKSFGQLLSWTHYRVLLQVEDASARVWYEKEALQQT